LQRSDLAPAAVGGFGSVATRPRGIAMRLDRRLKIVLSALVLCAALPEIARTQGAASVAAHPPVLFRDVRIFDGKSGRVSGPSDVLVRGNLIERIAASQAVEPGATVIDGKGRVLMPGLIDAHWHSIFVGIPLGVLLSADPNYVALVAGMEATRSLMRGF